MKLALCILVLSLVSGMTARAQQPAGSFQLAPLKIEGAKRYTAGDLARLSGLQTGQAITLADLQAAADRLVATGFFKQLKYRYQTQGPVITVTFEVDEAASTIPVVFDNFIWFPSEELWAAARKAVPSFDGTLPETEGAPDGIIVALQALLDARGIPGTVVMTPFADLKTQALRYLFKVERPAPSVCDVSVSGATPAIQREALAAAKPLIGQSYSHFFLTEMSRGTMQDIYRRHARLRAAIEPIAAKADAASCAGATVMFRVDEGPAYTWAGAMWSGNAVAPAADLDKLLGMRVGEPADDSKVRAGLRQIAVAYGRNGFLMFSATPAIRLDDATRRAVYQFAVSEGPQFRMGKLAFDGLPERQAEALRKRWKLAAGSVFDDAYPGTFLIKEVNPGPGGKLPEYQLNVDRVSLTVDVRLIFK